MSCRMRWAILRKCGRAGSRLSVSLWTQVLLPGTFTTDEESQALGREIARRLMLYYGRGIYAKFFDGPNTFQFGERLTVIEFKELEKAQKLQAVLFLGFMNLLRLQTKSPAWRGRKQVHQG